MSLFNKLHFDFDVNQVILKKISKIDVFQSGWEILGQKENRSLKELHKIATIQSTGSSTRIEGCILSDDEVQSLLKNLKITKLKTRDEEEIVGYYEVLELIFEQYPFIDFTENNILQFHHLLLKHSQKDQRHKGTYKNLSNEVVAVSPARGKKVIFKTTPPHLVAKEMQELIEWTNEQLSKKDIHPLLIIAIFVYEFLSIHPFQDGNGRLSRLLTTFLLLKEGYKFITYISFENQIEQQKKEYYEALMDGQKNRYQESENIKSWILFFLNSLDTLLVKLDKKYQEFLQKATYLSERQKQILVFIEERQPVKLADVANHFTHVSIHTIKKDIQILQKEKKIEKMGEYKGSIYITPLKP
ncbi:hypothetical protein AD998_21670 [bacterium 336/3]|nr:hypothetical protein AD998_21670 [bacterium 336/3]